MCFKRAEILVTPLLVGDKQCRMQPGRKSVGKGRRMGV